MVQKFNYIHFNCYNLLIHAVKKSQINSIDVFKNPKQDLTVGNEMACVFFPGFVICICKANFEGSLENIVMVF